MSQQTNASKIQQKISPLFHIQDLTGAEWSEINGWRVPLHYGSTEEEKKALQSSAVALDLSPRGKVVLRGEELDPVLKQIVGQSPGQTGQVIQTHPTHRDESFDITLARLTHDEVFLLTPPGEEFALIRTLRDQHDSQPGISWTDQTAGYAGFLLAGPRARDIMRKHTSLPLDDSSFPHHHAVQTRFAKTRAVIVRLDRAGLPGFEIYLDRSLGAYVWETILDAGRTWDLRPAGWQVYTSLRS